MELFINKYTIPLVVLVVVLIFGLAPEETQTVFRSAILITIDTLRGDHLGFSGNPDIRSPALDRLSKQSVVFSEAFTNIPITLPAHTAMMTSRLPRETGVDNNTCQLQPGFVTLAEILRSHGFSTAAYPQAILQFPRGLERGFDIYDGRASGKASGKVLTNQKMLSFHHGGYSPENEQGSVPKALKWLDERAKNSERYFLWMHFFEPHIPYKPPAPYRFIDQINLPDAVETAISEFSLHNDFSDFGFSEDEVRIARILYRNEISWVDTKLEHLFRRINTMGEDKPIVIVTADHGETLHDRYPYFNHGYRVNLEELHVPFFVYSGGENPGVIADFPIQSVDVAPSILAALGIEPLPEFKGSNVLDYAGNLNRILPFSLDRSPSRYCGALGLGYKVVQNLSDSSWLFWNRSVDPMELHSAEIDDTAPKEVLALQAAAMEYQSAETNVSLPETEPGSLDPEFKDMLESLGYLQ